MNDNRAASFTELVALFASRQRSRNTRLAYTADVERFAQWCDAEGTEPLAIGPADLDRYRELCQADGTSPATVARRLAALSSFFALAVEEGSVEGSPMADLVRPAAAPSATAELDAGQAAALVEAGERLSPKAALLVDLLLLDGLKLGEALAADAGDLADDGILTVARRRGTAQIELHGPTMAAAGSYLQGRHDGPLLLGDASAARLTRFGADYLLKRASEEAGLEQPVSANVLRRSYVAMAHANGDSIETIRDHMGHQDARTTRRHLSGA